MLIPLPLRNFNHVENQPWLGALVDRVGLCVAGTASILLISVSCMSLSVAASPPVLVVGLFGLRLFGGGAIMVRAQCVDSQLNSHCNLKKKAKCPAIGIMNL